VAVPEGGSQAAPVAHDDNYSLLPDTTLTQPAPGVLSNDTDADGDALSAVLVTGPAGAESFTLNSDGSFTYTPTIGFTGTDGFTYMAHDGTANSNLANVSITVSTANNAIYVYDIRFDSKRGNKDWRAVFEIRSDSNGNGMGDAGDSPIAGVQIEVIFAGNTYTGTTDANGIFRTSWIRNLEGGDHYANAVDLALTGYTWDMLLDLEDDSDSIAGPDALLEF
jgi:hypothetical protein